MTSAAQRSPVQVLAKSYVANVLRMPTVQVTENLLSLKREQHRLARQPKKATHESSKDTDRFPGKMSAVSAPADLRRIVANSMLALARKEISATDVGAMAKRLNSISREIGRAARFAPDAGKGELAVTRRGDEAAKP